MGVRLIFSPGVAWRFFKALKWPCECVIVRAWGSVPKSRLGVLAAEGQVDGCAFCLLVLVAVVGALPLDVVSRVG